MYTNQQPIDTIKSWQDWYRTNQKVASMEKPMATKDIREELHNTVDAVTTLIEAEAIKKATMCFADTIADVIEAEAIKKATMCFADTIAEYGCELNGVQLYKCFFAAAENNLEYTSKEYKKAKQLTDLLQDQYNEN